MQRIFSVKVFILVVVALTSSNALEGLNDQGFDCYTSRHMKCNPEAVNVIKDANSKFEMCPNSSRLCQEVNTKISLNESGLHIYDYSALYVLQGGSFLLNDNGLCKLFGNSFLEIDKNAIIRVDKGILVLSDRGELRSKGSVYVGQNSMLEVTSQSRFEVENNAELLMANGSKLEFGFVGTASLYIGSAFCSRHNRTRFLLGSGSVVRVDDHSTIDLQAGQIKVDDRASLWVFDFSKLRVAGLLHIKDKVPVTMSDGKSMVIGMADGSLESPVEHCSGNASLIITNGNAIPRELSIYQGAHCFTNKSVKSSYDFSTQAKVWLEHDSETKEFKCFNSRDKLMAAVNGI